MKKKLFLILAIVIFSCNNDERVNSDGDSVNSVTSPDSNATTHPNGLNEGAAISIDTGAYKTGDSIHPDTPR